MAARVFHSSGVGARVRPTKTGVLVPCGTSVRARVCRVFRIPPLRAGGISVSESPLGVRERFWTQQLNPVIFGTPVNWEALGVGGYIIVAIFTSH